jgi:hypothetical protein
MADLGEFQTAMLDVGLVISRIKLASRRRFILRDNRPMSTNPAETPKPDVSLRRLHDQECANFAIGSAALGPDLVGLVDEGFGLYLSLARTEAASSLPEKERISVTHFLMSCAKDLESAALSILRAHTSDSATYTRRAIEAAAFLLAIRSDHALFDLWKDAGDDEEKGREYRKRFNTGKVLPKDSPDPRLRSLRAAYDECSVLSHPTLESYRGRLRAAPMDPQASGAAFLFFEAGETWTGAEVLLWTLRVHVEILRVLSASYGEALGLAATEWPKRLGLLGDRCQVQARLWTLRTTAFQSAVPDTVISLRGDIMEALMKTSVDLPDELWTAAKIRAAQERKPLAEVIAEALKAHLGKPAGSDKPRKQKKGGKS